MTVPDKSQEAFEGWMASSNYPEIAEVAMAKLLDGNYKSQITYAGWQGWQAGVRFAAGRSATVHIVICASDGDEVRHIFSTRELAEAFMASDGRSHVYYDYVLDFPERHETHQQ